MQAGVGKTMLGNLLLYRWACAGQRVVAAKVSVLGNTPVLFCQEGVFELTATELQDEQDNPDVM
jgi:hypothetical protein